MALVISTPGARVLWEQPRLDLGLLESLRRPSWMAEAECSEWPAVTWFPTRREEAGPAKRLCAGCQVKAECLAYALADPTLVGIWAGTDEHDRRVMRSETA
jgi:WhiB family redox-sensing transcriptional regulator